MVLDASRATVLIPLISITLCVECGMISTWLFWRRRESQHIIFALFTSLAACMIASALLMQEAPAGAYRYVLAWYRVQFMTLPLATSLLIHFVHTVVHRPLSKAQSIRMYIAAGLYATTVFSDSILHLPTGHPKIADADSAEEGGVCYILYLAFNFAGFIYACCILAAKIRRDRNFRNLPSQGVVDTVPATDTQLLLVLIGVSAYVFAGAIEALEALDLLPLPDDMFNPRAVAALLMCGLISWYLGNEFLSTELRQRQLTEIAKARLDSLNDAQHQLKNQIRTIGWPLNTARLLLDRGADPQVLKGKLVKALNAVDELENTLNRMLNVARVDAGQELNLGEKAAVDIVVLVASLCHKRADLDLEASGSLSTDHGIFVFSDGDSGSNDGIPTRESHQELQGSTSVEFGGRLRVESELPHPSVYLRVTIVSEILHNLIDNAFKYSPPGSPILVRIGVGNTDADLIVEVLDHGKGVAPEDRDRIFTQPFYRGATGSRETAGTGLGLNLARRYAEAMGGKIWVESAGSGQGSTFIVALPYEPVPSFEAEPSAEGQLLGDKA